jgi:hypothetical protein
MKILLPIHRQLTWHQHTHTYMCFTMRVCPTGRPRRVDEKRTGLLRRAAVAPNHPAVVGPALTSKLRRAAACADGGKARHPLRVDDAEHGWSGPEAPGPVLRGRAEAAEPRARGEAGQQGPIGARPPAMERPVPYTLEGLPPSPGEHRPGPAGRGGVLGQRVALRLDVGEPSAHHVPGGQAALRGGEGWPGDQHGRGGEREQAQTWLR